MINLAHYNWYAYADISKLDLWKQTCGQASAGNQCKDYYNRTIIFRNNQYQTVLLLSSPQNDCIQLDLQFIKFEYHLLEIVL